jgi:NAD(P)-dependent dehydrogenase (short-subunit alcohol dehydrogenase family)
MGVEDLFDVAGRVVLVTGGSSGIGSMIAGGFADAGARVYISSRKADACRAMAEEISERRWCTALPADISSQAGCELLVAQLAARETRLDILVNNAGANWAAPLTEYPDAAWDKVLNTNVKAIFHLTRAALPLLEAAATPGQPARVINVGSVDGLHVPILETYAYTASKAAVHHLTRHLARNLGPRGITVNAIAPGPFQSKMMKATLELHGEEFAKASPLGRVGEPADMAGAAIYLASRASAWVTGVVIPVDGGLVTTQ